MPSRCSSHSRCLHPRRALPRPPRHRSSTTSRPLSQRLQSLERQWRAFTAHRSRRRQDATRSRKLLTWRMRSEKPLTAVPGADTCAVAMREDPAVKVRRNFALVVDIAALPDRTSSRLAGRRAHDLVVSEDVLRETFPAFGSLPASRTLRRGAVSTHDDSRATRVFATVAFMPRVTGSERARRLPESRSRLFEGGQCAVIRAGNFGGPLSQPARRTSAAIDHANEAANGPCLLRLIGRRRSCERC